jgi:hypothetical protein
MTTDEQLIDKLRAAMLADELIAKLPADRHPRIAIVPALTRLVGSADAGPGRLRHVRIYLVVYRPGRSALRVTTVELTTPGFGAALIAQAFRIRAVGGVQLEIGIARSVVPDGVRSVRWVFAAVGLDGQVHMTSVSAHAESNVAVARLPRGAGDLAEVAWIEPGGKVRVVFGATVVAFRDARRATAAQRQLLAASARQHVAASLVAHFGLLGTQLGYAAPATTVPGWATLVTSRRSRTEPGACPLPRDPDVAAARAQVRDLGRARKQRARLETWNVGGCNGLGPSLRGSLSISGTSARSTGIVGLVPDGNLSVTIVLSNGARRTAPSATTSTRSPCPAGWSR